MEEWVSPKEQAIVWFEMVKLTFVVFCLLFLRFSIKIFEIWRKKVR